MRKLLGQGFRKLAFHASADEALHLQHEQMGKNNTIFAVKAFSAQVPAPSSRSHGPRPPVVLLLASTRFGMQHNIPYIAACPALAHLHTI